MSRDALTTYLNDHLAGSIGALQLLERMIRDNEGDPGGPAEPVLRELDFDLLERRAAEQHREVEDLRLEEARAVL